LAGCAGADLEADLEKLHQRFLVGRLYNVFALPS
jgi:hypothetical protein